MVAEAVVPETEGERDGFDEVTLVGESVRKFDENYH